MTVMNMAQAINMGLEQEMRRNPKVMILGEDVGKDGGVFRVTDGLWAKFGDDRIVDTPLAEGGIIGASIGLAINGFRPVAEAQFDGFSLPMLDQLINHASRIRNRSRGRFTVPLVLRIPFGGGIRALEHHSDSPETHYIHTPGLIVVAPSSPYTAKGLIVSSLRQADPVIYLEPKRLYRSMKEDVPEEEYTIDLEKAQLVREGDDITVISYGYMTKVVREALEKMNNKYSVEVVDLLTLYPFDEKAILDSVKKTGRAVIVHEAHRTVGFGAEISAIINEKALLSLKAPVVRVTGYDVITPLPKIENYYFPDANKVINAIEKTMSF